MTITFNRRAALTLAAGMWIGLAGHVMPGFAQEAEPAATAEAAEAPGKPIALKKFTKQQVSKHRVASTSKAHKAAAAKARTTDAAEDASPATVVGDAGKATLPASIANANAQVPAEATPDPFAPTSQAAANPLQADALIKSVGAESHQEAATDAATQVVAPDELNEIDRAAAETRPALTLASATLDAPAAAPVVATSADNSTWDKTSLIGKVFIAFGGLLTMASAARMFMA